MFAGLALAQVFSSIWGFITSRVGLPIVVAAAMLIFYEGIPIGPLRLIPYVGQYFAMVTDGRVDKVRGQARADVENEARARAMYLIEMRNKDNKEITDLDASGLCAELGGRWVQTEKRCD